MIRRAVLALILSCASPVVAQDLSLIPPVACDLSQDCYIQQYVDHDTSAGWRDFTCSGLSYDGHKGTDFAVKTLSQMREGVRVISAAPGTVISLRDGMPDTGFTPETAEAIKGRECGNGVVIRHEGGWETQYCHLRKGTVTVSQGQEVAAGTTLGLIGLSGRTEFPHVHLSVRRGRNVVDPFDPDGTITCNSPGDSSLWEERPVYQPGGILDVGFADALPSFDAVKDGSAHRDDLGVSAPALVVYGFTFGTRAKDSMSLSITGPAGTVIERTVTLDRSQARAFRAIGKRARRDWPAGRYTATAELMRDGKRISFQSRSITLR